MRCTLRYISSLQQSRPSLPERSVGISSGWWRAQANTNNGMRDYDYALATTPNNPILAITSATCCINNTHTHVTAMDARPWRSRIPIGWPGSAADSGHNKISSRTFWNKTKRWFRHPHCTDYRTSPSGTCTTLLGSTHTPYCTIKRMQSW